MEEAFHGGERTIQRIAGEEEIANSLSKLITGSIAKGANNFIEKQPMVIVCSKSDNGQVWVSLLIGTSDFAIVQQPDVVLFNENRILSTSEDILYKNILKESEIGTLFIEFYTRRRLRINGSITRMNGVMKMEVREVYSNCPKYIQRRTIALPDHSVKTKSDITCGNELTKLERDWILNADTFFVGSSASNGRLDASHRGGSRGFVEILEGDILKIPDYKGNSFYNTLGNILQNANVGLLFVDFEQGKTLQLTGKAEVMFNEQPPKLQTNMSNRFWLFKSERWICVANHHKVNSQFIDYSPFNP